MHLNDVLVPPTESARHRTGERSSRHWPRRCVGTGFAHGEERLPLLDSRRANQRRRDHHRLYGHLPMDSEVVGASRMRLMSADVQEVLSRSARRWRRSVRRWPIGRRSAPTTRRPTRGRRRASTTSARRTCGRCCGPPASEGYARIAVVCGAWHVPALAEPLPTATSDAALLRGLPKVPVAMTWVPWTHGRLALPPPATAPAWPRPAGTTTCSRRRTTLSSAGSSRSRRPAARGGPADLQRARDRGDPARRDASPCCAAGRVAGPERGHRGDARGAVRRRRRAARAGQRAAGRRRSARRACPPRRRRCRWSATSPPRRAGCDCRPRRWPAPSTWTCASRSTSSAAGCCTGCGCSASTGARRPTSPGAARARSGSRGSSAGRRSSPVDLIAAGRPRHDGGRRGHREGDRDGARRRPTSPTVTGARRDVPARRPAEARSARCSALDAKIAARRRRRAPDGQPAGAGAVAALRRRPRHRRPAALAGVVAGLVTRVCVGLPAALARSRRRGRDGDARPDRRGARGARRCWPRRRQLREAWLDTLTHDRRPGRPARAARRPGVPAAARRGPARRRRGRAANEPDVDDRRAPRQRRRPGSRGSSPAVACCWCTTRRCSRSSTAGSPRIPPDTFIDVLPLLRRTFATFAAPERRTIGAAGSHLIGAGDRAEHRRR